MTNTNDRPIIFSATMVKALLEGRKTQTRRALKLPTRTHSGGPIYEHPKMGGWAAGTIGGKGCYLDPDHTIPAPERACIWHQTTGTTMTPKYQAGDRLWVREAIDRASDRDAVFYRADYEAENPGPSDGLGWRPSIHMPRWASRLTLTVTDVRVERLQGISDEDAKAEGVRPLGPGSWTVERGDGFHAGGTSPRATFACLWNSIHGPDAWDANPWVGAISFTVNHGNIDKIGGDE